MIFDVDTAGVYIHLPFCKQKCAYCDFFSLADCGKFADDYVAAVIKEAAEYSYLKKTVKTLYFGGGTPSVLPRGKLAQLVEAVKSNFVTDLVEVTAEGNPESLTTDKLAEYKGAGVNRVSIGIQSLNDIILGVIGRLHDANTAIKVVEQAKKTFDNVSVDLMLGLPYQTKTDVVSDINRLADLGVDHISCYGLKLEDGTPLKRLAAEEKIKIPSDDDCADLYDLAVYEMKKRGFERYEVSNFAKDNKVSLHNLNYWKRVDYIGLGAAAASFLEGKRFVNVADIKKYIDGAKYGAFERIDEGAILGEEAEFEEIMLALRTECGLNIASFEHKFATDFKQKYQNQIAKLKDFCHFDGENFRVNADKFYVLNSILQYFT